MPRKKLPTDYKIKVVSRCEELPDSVAEYLLTHIFNRPAEPKPEQEQKHDEETKES